MYSHTKFFISRSREFLHSQDLLKYNRKTLFFDMIESGGHVANSLFDEIHDKYQRKEKIDLIERVTAQGHPVAILSVKWH